MLEGTICAIQPHSGLCNRLFMIAAAYAHAKRNKYVLRLIKTDTKYWETYLHNCVDMIGSYPNASRHWREPRFSYIPIPPDHTTMTGYFQSARYFADVSGEIRALFDPPTSLKEAVIAAHQKLLTSSLIDHSVVVHIRRGDYLLGGNRLKHGILDERYYQRAMSAARAAIPDCRFLVFSDDLPWCRTQSWLADAVFVDEPSDVHALWLMSRFRNFIMSNSTFSWWAVWLSDYKNGGHVWVPNKWFGPMGPPDWHDIYESEWVRLPIT